jgi:hypothetical protein
MKRGSFLGLLICLGSYSMALPSSHAATTDLLSHRPFHLRSGTEPEWQEFATTIPDGTGVTVRFPSRFNPSEVTLFIHQDNVKLDWGVVLNGKKLGNLFLMEAPLVRALPVPKGLLRDGENTLEILPPKENDDILVGDVSLVGEPLADALRQAEVQIEVIDQTTRTPLPCRITIIDDQGNLTPLSANAGQKLAVRPGVVYTPDGRATLGLLPGSYTVYATRGFEYGLAKAQISIAALQTAPIRLEIAREVHTPGLVSCDTHTHTFTYARHGDATVDERVITLAGEGIELPISTEHDCLVDYSGAAQRMGVAQWLTPVIGEEVTTAKGHFNIFPLDLLTPTPSNQITNWPNLMEAFRATPGVQVVVLNHPRNIHNNFQPFAATNFNAVTGSNLRGFDFTFDAIEVANSSALQSDWMISYRDWFALLNHGYRFTAVGSSDVHDVSRYIVGQGRTYVACPDKDPGHLDIQAACRSLRRGKALVSLGLLTEITVADRFTAGDLATGLAERVPVRVKVLGPSWVKADRVELYANGVKLREEKISSSSSATGNGPVDLEIEWVIPRPPHDAQLIALASGPGIREPYWALARPYQPSSPVWDPRVVGVTNPVWLDADGDGKFTSPRAYAQRLWQEFEPDPDRLLWALQWFDEAVASQAAELCQAAGINLHSQTVQKAIAGMPERIRLAFEQGGGLAAATR